MSMAYTPTNWSDGDLITAEKLNKLEKGVQNEQVGPQGPEGPTGPTGATGPQGENGSGRPQRACRKRREDNCSCDYGRYRNRRNSNV